MTEDLFILCRTAAKLKLMETAIGILAKLKDEMPTNPPLVDIKLDGAIALLRESYLHLSKEHRRAALAIEDMMEEVMEEMMEKKEAAGCIGLADTEVKE